MTTDRYTRSLRIVLTTVFFLALLQSALLVTLVFQGVNRAVHQSQVNTNLIKQTADVSLGNQALLLALRSVNSASAQRTGIAVACLLNTENKIAAQIGLKVSPSPVGPNPCKVLAQLIRQAQQPDHPLGKEGT